MITPPKALKKPEQLLIHDDLRIDDYYWMRKREAPEVLQYLQEENQYYKEQTQHTQQFQETLFQEIKSKIKTEDNSVPFKRRGYWYYTRFKQDGNYPLYCRKKGSLEADEEVLLNGEEMAIGQAYFKISGLTISPDNRYAAFGVDTVSRRKYTLYIKDLETGAILEDRIENTTGNMVWANDNRTLFYTKKEEQTLRSDRVFKHIRGTSVDRDQLIFTEEDETFDVQVTKTKSERFIFIASGSTTRDEYRFIAADNPEQEFQVLQPRTKDLEYGVTHYGDYFYILTNVGGAKNYKLIKTPVQQPGIENWEVVIPHRTKTLLEDADIFKDYLVLSERTNGLNQLRIISWDGATDYYIPFESETYTAATVHNPEFDTRKLRYVYNSLTTPTQVIDFDMDTQTKELKKEYSVQDPNFKSSDYRAERLWATAEDGTEIPISLVYRKGMQLEGKNPLLLYGYGSYGITVDPTFSISRLSLLDRGFIFAIAHVRGGEYLGRKWYEEGKLLKKRHTFTDFIACSQYLIKQNYTGPEHLYAMGGSAGGMLMGVILNEAPKLYNGVVAAVPFVDVVTTMLDDTIPLTTGEYEEWGNPNEPEYYKIMKSYSPYDNVKEQEYPNILVTTGYHDSQVQYWEPAKWVAKLRELKTDNHRLLFHINMEAGHGGASGRFDSLKETVEEYAFLLDLEGEI